MADPSTLLPPYAFESKPSTTADAMLQRVTQTIGDWTPQTDLKLENMVVLSAAEQAWFGTVLNRHRERLRQINGGMERARIQLMETLVAGGLQQGLADAILSYVDLKVSTDVAVKEIVTHEARTLYAQLDPAQALSATELAKLLGVTDETVRNREQAGELFSLLRPGRKRGREYPAFQVWEGVRGAPLTQVLEALSHPGGPQAYAFFTSPTDTLGSLSPLQVLTGTAADDVDQEVREFLQASQEQRLSAVVEAARAYAADLAA